MLDLGPIEPTYLRRAFRVQAAAQLVPLYAAWGGVPRYWELASECGAGIADQLDHLVLDPLGPLHREPDRLLIEEVPSALEVRPALDAIGAGAHRVSEIAGRLGRPATSMARPLDRLVGIGLVRREVPFGESERQSRRSLYRIDDPFFRLLVSRRGTQPRAPGGWRPRQSPPGIASVLGAFGCRGVGRSVPPATAASRQLDGAGTQRTVAARVTLVEWNAVRMGCRQRVRRW